MDKYWCLRSWDKLLESHSDSSSLPGPSPFVLCPAVFSHFTGHRHCFHWPLKTVVNYNCQDDDSYYYSNTDKNDFHLLIVPFFLLLHFQGSLLKNFTLWGKKKNEWRLIILTFNYFKCLTEIPNIYFFQFILLLSLQILLIYSNVCTCSHQ